MHLVTFECASEFSPPPGRARRSQANNLSKATTGFDRLEFSRPGSRRLGALTPLESEHAYVVDLNRALAVKLGFEDAGAPEAEADSLLPSDMLSFLRRRDAQRLAREAFDWALDALGRYDAPDLRSSGVAIRIQDTRLCAPVPRPRKILGVACNYETHARERGAALPTEPVLFLKSSRAVIGSGADIVLPRVSKQVDYEGELAVVIGRTARDVSAEEALDVVAGYTAANDVTARDFQNTRGQQFIGKSCDTFAPLGPALVTSDEIPDPQSLALRTLVSAEERQRSSTKEMIFSVPELVSFTSRLMTLEAGDVILTGTPEGVGAASDPPRWLRDGDLVEVEIERVGRLRNYVRSEHSR